MMDADTLSWRESVVGSLADIKAQLGRLASDRESEKETIIRLTTRLDGEDRRNVERLDKHVEWNDAEHGKLHERINKIDTKVTFGAGVLLTLQFLVTIAVAVVAIFK